MLIIRPLNISDLADVKIIEKKCHAYPWSSQIFHSNLGRRYFNFVLTENNIIKGYYFANQVVGEANLLNITVDSDHQGQGYGKQLLAHLIEECKRQDLYQVWLEVRDSNINAHQLYSNTGFCEVDRRLGYYPILGGREDAIIMCYNI